MSLQDAVSRRVTRLLCQYAGTRVHIAHSEPVTEGWSALRFPFPACGCSSHLPADVGRRAENAYRQELARSCPDVLDHSSYAHGLAAACAAWTIVRMVRLPKLENADVPHPLGFSRRGQLLDTIGTTVRCADQSGSLHSLAAWLADAGDALRARWPHITPAQPFYPAFQSRNSARE